MDEKNWRKTSYGLPIIIITDKEITIIELLIKFNTTIEVNTL